RALAGDPELAVDDVLDVLTGLSAKHLVVWKVEVASQLHPEADLARRLDRIGDPTLRERCLRELRSLVDARDRLAACEGAPQRLERELEALDATFTRLTGNHATRRHGQTYAARGLIYQDCRRDGSVALGRAFLDRLGPPLAVVLGGVRWLVGEAALAVQ